MTAATQPAQTSAGDRPYVGCLYPLVHPGQVRLEAVQWKETVMPTCSLDTLQAIRLKVVEAAPDAFVVINREQEVVDCNEEAEFLFGYGRGDLIGRPIANLIPEEAREAHSKHVGRFYKSPRRREMGITGMTLEGLNRDGERFPVRIRLAPIVVEGPEGGVFGLAIVRRTDT
jgi:PAS domain S-box-containing protein